MDMVSAAPSAHRSPRMVSEPFLLRETAVHTELAGTRNRFGEPLNLKILSLQQRLCFDSYDAKQLLRRSLRWVRPETGLGIPHGTTYSLPITSLMQVGPGLSRTPNFFTVLALLELRLPLKIDPLQTYFPKITSRVTEDAAWLPIRCT